MVTSCMYPVPSKLVPAYVCIQGDLHVVTLWVFAHVLLYLYSIANALFVLMLNCLLAFGFHNHMEFCDYVPVCLINTTPHFLQIQLLHYLLKYVSQSVKIYSSVLVYRFVCTLLSCDCPGVHNIIEDNIWCSRN